MQEIVNFIKDGDWNVLIYFFDLLYQANLKDVADAYAYVLFEYKNHPAPFFAFNLLRYMVKI